MEDGRGSRVLYMCEGDSEVGSRWCCGLVLCGVEIVRMEVSQG